MPLCDMAVLYCHMFHAVLKTFLCTMTSCDFNFDPGILLWFCKHGLRALALSLRKSTFYTLQEIDRALSLLAALTHLTVLVHEFSNSPSSRDSSVASTFDPTVV